MPNYFNPAAAAAALPLTTATTTSDVHDMIAAAHQATLAALNAADLVLTDPDVVHYLYDAAIALNKAKNATRDV